jgi:L-lactate dehydrogenase complex protein LldG
MNGPASRDVILTAIREALKRPRPAELHADSGPSWPPAPPLKTGLERFRELFDLLGGRYAEARAPEEVAAVLERLARERGMRRVYATETPLLARMRIRETLRRLGVAVESPYARAGADGRAQAAELDVLVTGADAVIAESATFAYLARPGEGRMTTLIAPVHVVLFTPDQLVETLDDALARVADPIRRGERSCLTFITGPSRTADIEQQLTVGVHGPGELHAVRIV